MRDQGSGVGRDHSVAAGEENRRDFLVDVGDRRARKTDRLQQGLLRLGDCRRRAEGSVGEEVPG
ncbi:hypothetical protein D3C80_2178610 [compost metagenome]